MRVLGEDQAQFRARMRSEGRWEEYLNRRAELIGVGFASIQASQILRETDFVVGSRPGQNFVGDFGGAEKESSVIDDQSDLHLVADGEPFGTSFRLTGSALNEGEQAEQRLAAKSGVDVMLGKSDRRFVEAFGDCKQQASMAVVVNWIFNNLDNPLVEPNNAPSSGAWSWLQLCKHNPAMKAEFFRTCVVKLLPSKSEVDKGFQAKDDNRRTFELLDRYEESIGTKTSGS